MKEKLSELMRRTERALFELREISVDLGDIELFGLYSDLGGHPDFSSFATGELGLSSRALKGLKEISSDFSFVPGEFAAAGAALNALLYLAAKILEEF